MNDITLKVQEETAGYLIATILLVLLWANVPA